MNEAVLLGGRPPGLYCFPAKTLTFKWGIERWYIIGYINAEDILPDELMSEIRRYIEGEAIYIPRSSGRVKWGGNTGTREEFDKRNRTIQREYDEGKTIRELSLEYCLCSDSIRKILKKR